MLDYQEHSFPLGSDSDLRLRVEATLKENPVLTRTALDGWIGRRSDIDSASIEVEAVHADGNIDLAFTETSWMACRVETGTARHHHQIRYRLEPDRLVLLTLPRDAFPERIDEL